MPSEPIYMETVSAPTNIACVKYWGKASVEHNTPINSSVSVTLDQSDLRAVTTASASKSFPTDRLWLNGTEEDGAATSKRFRACVDGVRRLATDRIDPDTGPDRDPDRHAVSLYGGFVAWRKGGAKEDWSDSIAEQVAPETHWPEIRAIILVVSDAKKDT
eukprot:CAMPEP_0178601378 /NCGR_PEP_ID=MMETSP0697-20121206/34368_1 /TAXON_ID=265572 /ORGANISM="Extubocellulus spinifer, Strain CCMP396" /LENGTH=159 /DNA_ID=CAMNT_0020239457 /DNA_START=44 /DNA_END=518 /DNA_ORIENTATION=+